VETAFFRPNVRYEKNLKTSLTRLRAFPIFFAVLGSTKTIVTSPSTFSERKDEGSGFFVVFGNRVERAVVFAHVAQLAERVLGKDEVISSTLIMGSIKTKQINAGE
jgi:hypothetical protein